MRKYPSKIEMKLILSLLGLWFFVFAFSNKAKAQDLSELDSMSTLEFIDTVFIDRDLKNWSFRIYSNLKEHRARVSNNQSSVKLVPNNPFGVGFGIATKKLILDIGFNIKPGKEQTNRFDLQGTLISKHDQFGVFLQHYKGYNVKSEESGTSQFREDIVLQSSGFRYMYMFNASEYSYSSLKTGLEKQKKSSSSFGVGGFLLQISQKGDSTFVSEDLEPSFNPQGRIVSSSSFGLGASVGFSAFIVLPKNFFIGLGCTGGLGLVHNKLTTQTETFMVGNPLIYQIGLIGDIGYNVDKVYINLSLNNNLYGSQLGYGNTGYYNQVNAKLAVGLKIGKHKNVP